MNLTQRYLDLVKLTVMDATLSDPPRDAIDGKVWPQLALTMIGSHRLDNIRSCIEQLIADRIPGDLIETGVWRGGAAIYMRAILAAAGIVDRTVWVADSFAGLPAGDETLYPADAGDTHHTFKVLAVDLDTVRRNFERLGLLDNQVRFLHGWFKDTLPHAPIGRLALLRLDGDMYGSTWEALEHLYPLLQPGGFVIVDDYGSHPAQCAAAVRDYRNKYDITETMIPIDWAGVFWRRDAR